VSDGVDIPITTPGGAESAATLRSIAVAMQGLGTASQETGAKTSAAFAAFNFNQVSQAVRTVAIQIDAFADAVAALASEQAQLDANSSRLGLNFDDAADAAGRFTDETEAMTAATRLAESGIRLSQNELNSLTRVAAAFAQNTGVTTREAIDTLTQGLITGSERGLRPFGGELRAAAGETHTITDRLAALAAQAGHTARATDDAASSFERFKDSIEDSQRSLASGFAEGITEMQNAARAAREASGATDSWTDHLRELGQAAGVVAAFVAASFNLAFEAVRYTAREIGSEVMLLGRMIAHPTQAGALREGMTATRAANRRDLDLAVAQIGALDIFGDRGRRTAAPDALPATSRGATDMTFTTEEITSDSARRSGGRGARRAEDDKTAKTAEMAADEARRARELAQMRADRELSTEILRVERERAQVAREVADSWAEQVTHSEEYARIQARSRGLEQESVVASEVRILRARAAGQRGESAIGQRAELEDARDPAVQRERIDEMRRTHTLDRERSHLTQRYEMQRSYVDRMEELHSTEADGTRALAEGVSGAFAGMGQAIAKHAQGLIDGKESVGEALQGMLSDTLASLAQQAVVKGAMETAEGIAALAGIVTAPLAPGHFAAAGAYFGVAALAGIGAAATAPSSASAAPPSAPAPAPAPESAARVSGSKGTSSEGGGVVYNINFGGPMYGTGGVRQAARQMVGAINRGGIQGGVQLLPGVLQGAGAGT
jgi:hypothetical protein